MTKRMYFENVYAVLDGRDLDYLVVNHMEPDHASAISQVLTNFPNATVVTTAASVALIQQFFGMDISDRLLVVAEGDTLTTGAHALAFVEAPMVHWPEVMVTFDATTIENGSWSPAAGQLMQDIVATMPNMFKVGELVTLRSTTSDANVEELKALAGAIAASVLGDESLKVEMQPSETNAQPAAGTVEAAEAATAAVYRYAISHLSRDTLNKSILGPSWTPICLF